MIQTNEEMIVRRRKVANSSAKTDLNYRKQSVQLSGSKNLWIDSSNRSFVDHYFHVLVNAFRTLIFRLTGIPSVEPTKKIINDLLQKFSSNESESLSPEELFSQKLSDNDLESALELALNFGFDADIVYQRMWRTSPINQQSVEQFLSKISDTLWALRECLECVALNLDDMRYLLQFGLNLTDFDNFKLYYFSRAPSDNKHKSPEVDSEADPNEEIDNPKVEGFDSGVVWNDLSLESKQVCIWRKRLLQYLDRLNVYEMMLSYRNANNSFNHKFYQMFREMSAFEAAIHCARDSDHNAISLLLTYEPKEILDHRLVILSNIDETLSPKRYSSILPKVIHPKIKGKEVYEWNQIKLRDDDWVEERFGSDCALSGTQFESEFYSENTVYLKYKTSYLTKPLLSQWYSERSKEILALTDLVSNALDLVEIGIKNMVPGLDKLQSDLDVFALIIYDSNCKEDINFEDFQSFSNNKKIELLMSEALQSEQQFLQYIRKFLKVFISKICKDDSNLLQTMGRDLFKDYLMSVAKNNLNLCLKVFENSTPSNEENDKSCENVLIEDPCDLFEFAIDCIYASEDSSQLETAFKIMECLPQREMVPIIVHNDSNKIKRLNLLNDLADKLENYLVVSEIIEQYMCPPTVAHIRDLEMSGDREGVKLLFVTVLRNCAKKEKPLTVNDWIDVFKNLTEVRKMCFTDCITEDELFEAFVETLLCSARKENFGLAAGYMQLNSVTKYKKKVIPFQKAKKLVIKAAQEYINSSDSMLDHNIVLATECLNLIDQREQLRDPLIKEELNFIEGLSVIEDNFDLNLLPIQLRLIPQPKLELIEKLLNSSPKAYTKISKILQISQLLNICADFDTDYRNGTILSMIANFAIDSNDFKIAFNACEMIIKSNYTIGWKVCLRLGLNPDYKCFENRLQLLCFALTYCHLHCDDDNEDNTQIIDIINAIKQLKTSSGIKLAHILF